MASFWLGISFVLDNILRDPGRRDNRLLQITISDGFGEVCEENKNFDTKLHFKENSRSIFEENISELKGAIARATRLT